MFPGGTPSTPTPPWLPPPLPICFQVLVHAVTDTSPHSHAWSVIPSLAKHSSKIQLLRISQFFQNFKMVREHFSRDLRAQHSLMPVGAALYGDVDCLQFSHRILSYSVCYCRAISSATGRSRSCDHTGTQRAAWVFQTVAQGPVKRYTSVCLRWTFRLFQCFPLHCHNSAINIFVYLC